MELLLVHATRAAHKKRGGKNREKGWRDERMKGGWRGRQIEGWRRTEGGGQRDEQGQEKKGEDAGVGRVREEGMEGDMEEVEEERRAAWRWGKKVQAVSGRRDFGVEKSEEMRGRGGGRGGEGWERGVNGGDDRGGRRSDRRRLRWWREKVKNIAKQHDHKIKIHEGAWMKQPHKTPDNLKWERLI